MPSTPNSKPAHPPLDSKPTTHPPLRLQASSQVVASGRGATSHLPLGPSTSPQSYFIQPALNLSSSMASGKRQVGATCHLSPGSSSPSQPWFIQPALNLSSSMSSGKLQMAGGGATCHLPSGSSIPFQPWFIQPALNLSSSVASVKWLPLATWLIHHVATPVHLACSQLELISGKWQVAGVPLANWLIHLFSWPQNPTFTKCLAIVHSRLLGQPVGACWVNLFVFLQFFADPAYIFSSTRCI